MQDARISKCNPRYPWQRYYEAAILEPNRAALTPLITAADAAINARIAEIQNRNDGTPAEMQAIADARAGLRILVEEVRSRSSSE
jgi:hypothetical protein